MDIKASYEEAKNKLRTGMLSWQLYTTIQLAGFYLLFIWLGAITKPIHSLLWLGAYIGFTLYHAIFYAFWRISLREE
jgi:hypothetical protein